MANGAGAPPTARLVRISLPARALRRPRQERDLTAGSTSPFAGDLPRVNGPVEMNRLAPARVRGSPGAVDFTSAGDAGFLERSSLAQRLARPLAAESDDNVMTWCSGVIATRDLR
jgi:hypothetical protein